MEPGFGEFELFSARLGESYRRQYTSSELVDQMVACAERLGCSPTTREFDADPQTLAHSQTIIERFGTWNAAKRAAGMRPRRYMTRKELLQVLRDLGAELGRPPTVSDFEERRGSLPSKSLYWHRFGSLGAALQEAGFDVPITDDERRAWALDRGVALAVSLGHLPKMAEWKKAAKHDDKMPTEWQVYRWFRPPGDTQRRAWEWFLFHLFHRLRSDGVRVSGDGRVFGKAA